MHCSRRCIWRNPAQRRKSTWSDWRKIAGRRVPQITQETSGVRQIPFQKLAGSDFPIGVRRKVLTLGTGSISSEPTHVLIRNEIVRERPSAEAPGNRELNRGYRVRLVDTVEGTWALVAREGQSLGYIPVEALVKPFKRAA